MNSANAASQLEQAHEQAAQIFGRYSLHQQVVGCPCCVSAADRAELLRGDLRRYAFKAMTTWGDETDFKHFLPTILAALTPAHRYYPSTVHGGACDLQCLANKLRYAHWQQWPAAEQQAVQNCLQAWWLHCLVLVQHDFMEFMTDCSADGWGNSVGPAYQELAESDLVSANWLQEAWREAMQPALHQTPDEYVQTPRFLLLVDWLYEGQYERAALLPETLRYLEAGFFAYADRAPALAQRISDLLYGLELLGSLPATGSA